MTDALSQIAKDQRETAKLLREGKIMKCFICWDNIKNDKEAYKEHIKEHHTLNQLVNEFCSITIDLWNDKYKDAILRLYLPE